MSVDHAALGPLKERVADIDFEPGALNSIGGRPSDQIAIRVEPFRLIEVMGFLKDDPRTSFEQLCDLTCVDYLNFPKARDRFCR